MALSIKTDEADELTRRLCRLTGESPTAAVTVALRERLNREQAKRGENDALPDHLAAFANRLREAYDTRPVSREEWGAASAIRDDRRRFLGFHRDHARRGGVGSLP